MEITQRRRFNGQDKIIGIGLVLFGSLLLFQQLDLFYLEDFGVRSFWHLWPFLIVLIGAGKIIDSQTPRSIGSGAWLIFIGLWLYVSIYHVYGLTFSQTWPAVVIAWGVSMIWESATKQSKKTEEC